MRGLVLAVIAGALFAAGLVVSGMTVPSRVTGFLDVASWDPTLGFVMLGAIAIHAPLLRFVKGQRRPLCAPVFHAPPPSRLGDPRLVGGAALFGVGWALSGYCPGPALASLGGGLSVLVFVGAMIAGMALTRTALRL